MTGIAGIIKEGSRLLGMREFDGALKDAALIAGAQKAEHYEMADMERSPRGHKRLA